MNKAILGPRECTNGEPELPTSDKSIIPVSE